MKRSVVVLAALLVLGLWQGASMAQGLSGVLTGDVPRFETLGSDSDPSALKAETISTPEKLDMVEGADANAPVMVEQ